MTKSTFEAASSGLGFGPEMEAIIEDDSDVDTRWRYYLRYLQVSDSSFSFASFRKLIFCRDA